VDAAVRGHDRERYAHVPHSDFRSASEAPLSTFSVDVDTASYANLRRFLSHGQLPPVDAVRIEELINYFDYDCGAPEPGHPLAVATELSDSPFGGGRKLLRVGLRAVDPEGRQRLPRNLVFLVDTSGSMQDRNKLPLLQHALGMLVDDMDERDTLAIVTYAGSSGIALHPTPGSQRGRIDSALRSLRAGGSTNGAAGIELAYQLAMDVRQPGAINRVILATDGDFNVGVTDEGSLLRLIEHRREHGIFLTVLGFGMGNLNDSTMELLADHGNGNYAYIDTEREAYKVLVEEAGSTLRTVAKDAKIQLELNPARVARYRLIGYENRRLQDRDFADDRKDAGDMGDGSTVTALYELELVGDSRDASAPAPLRYQHARPMRAGASDSDELAFVKVRYKEPEGSDSRLLSVPVRAGAQRFDRASSDLRFAAAVAGFGMLLRGSPHVRELTLADVYRMAAGAVGRDPGGHRGELVELVARAEQLGAAR
jgi:Ca-activated chloride channel family protein